MTSFGDEYNPEPGVTTVMPLEPNVDPVELALYVQEYLKGKSRKNLLADVKRVNEICAERAAPAPKHIRVCPHCNVEGLLGSFHDCPSYNGNKKRKRLLRFEVEWLTPELLALTRSEAP